MAEVFANPLAELAEYTDMKQDMDKGKGPIQVSGVTDSQKVHVMHELSKEHPWRLVVTYDDNRAKEIYDDFSYFEPNTWLYPARDLLFYSSDIHGNLRRDSGCRCLNTFWRTKAALSLRTWTVSWIIFCSFP